MTDTLAAPTDAPGPEEPSGSSRLLRVGGFALSLLVVVLAALLVPMPFIEAAPGGATDVGELVRVDAPTTELTGELDLLTVRVDTPSIVEVVRAWVDDERDLRPPQSVIPAGTDARTYFALQRETFRSSFRVAAAVGLRAAGEDITIRTAPQVAGVLPDGPADGALRVGDVVRTFEGRPVASTDDLIALGRQAALGEELDLSVVRDGEPLRVTVTAGRVPGLDHPGMGITLQTLEEDIELPFAVELIDQQGIGGPSAGMMIALAVYDLVAEEDLVAGRTIVGTGSVRADGTVGRIGSVREKTFTAVAAGADLMLVPASQAAEALAAARGRVEVVGVQTVADAIATLRG